LLFCLHIKSSSLLCAVCSTLYTFPRNDIVQSSRSRAFCSYYGLQTFTHRESSPHNPQHTRPPFVSPALALLGVVPRYLSKNLCTCGVGILVVDYRREMPRGIKHKSCAAILDI
jgi:hypothetical protein